MSDSRTQLTQQIALEGEQAETYTAQMDAGFEQGILDGMEKLRAAMEQSFGGAKAHFPRGPAQNN